MLAPDLPSAVARLRDLIDQADVIQPFTGAGISTECGIPDFRSPGGLWTKTQPIPFDQFMASAQMRDEAWRRRFAMDDAFRNREAGPRSSRAREPVPVRQGAGGHHAEHRQSTPGIRRFGRRCRRVARQYHLRHLSDMRETLRTLVGEAEIRLGRSRARLRIAAATSKPPPYRSVRPCRSMKWRRAEELSSSCDLFIAIGSSLVVWPAAGFPLHAKRNGARLVIVNREPTDFDEIADLVVRQDIGEALGPFVAH